MDFAVLGEFFLSRVELFWNCYLSGFGLVSGCSGLEFVSFDVFTWVAAVW